MYAREPGRVGVTALGRVFGAVVLASLAQVGQAAAAETPLGAELCRTLEVGGPDAAPTVDRLLAAGPPPARCTVTRSAQFTPAIVNNPLWWLAAPVVPAAVLISGIRETRTWTVGVPPLALAAALVDDRPFHALLARGASPTEVDSVGVPVLAYAVRGARLAKDPSRVEALLARGADANGERVVAVADVTKVYQVPAVAALLRAHGWSPCGARDQDGATALHYAAGEGDVVLVGALLAAGCEVDAVDEQDRTPLVRAAGQGHAAAVRVLLAAGAAPGGRGYAPLSAVANRSPDGELEVMALLVAAGAPPGGGGDVEDRSPLHVYASRNEAEPVRWLIAHGAAVDARDAEGRTPLHVAADGAGDATVTLLLLGAGADPDAVANDGDTPLLLALAAGGARRAAALLASGANPLARTANGWGAAHVAATYYSPEPLAIALASGASVRDRDLRGRTPLHYAESPAVVKALLAAGAELDAADGEGVTPLFRALCSPSDGQLVTLLMARGARLAVPGASTALHAVARSGGEAELDTVLRLGLAVDVQDGVGNRPIHVAVARPGEPGLEMLRALVARGASVESAGALGARPLHVAVAGGDLDRVRWLLDHGASVDSRDDAGRSPLALAVAAAVATQAGTTAPDPRVATVKELLARGAAPLSTDTEGRTPFSLALGGGDVELLATLARRLPNPASPPLPSRVALPDGAFAAARSLWIRGVTPVMPGGIRAAIVANESKVARVYAEMGEPLAPELLDLARESNAPAAFLELLALGAGGDVKELRGLLRRARGMPDPQWYEEPLRAALRVARGRGADGRRPEAEE